VITKVTTQDTPKPVSKELWHRLYRNLKLPTNTVRQSTATSQFNRLFILLYTCLVFDVYVRTSIDRLSIKDCAYFGGLEVGSRD
jgi:hypothetical protein